MTSGQTATTKNQRMKRAIKFPQCPPSAATKVAGARYEYEKLAGGKEALLNETGVAHRLATPDEMPFPLKIGSKARSCLRSHFILLIHSLLGHFDDQRICHGDIGYIFLDFQNFGSTVGIINAKINT